VHGWVMTSTMSLPAAWRSCRMASPTPSESRPPKPASSSWAFPAGWNSSTKPRDGTCAPQHPTAGRFRSLNLRQRGQTGQPRTGSTARVHRVPLESRRLGAHVHAVDAADQSRTRISEYDGRPHVTASSAIAEYGVTEHGSAVVRWHPSGSASRAPVLRTVRPCQGHPRSDCFLRSAS
jgi:hypothetical protein